MKSNFLKPGSEVARLHSLASVCVSDYFYDAVFRHFPILRKRADYRIFFWYLCLGAYYDKDYDKLLLCRHTIAALLEKDEVNFVAQDFFAEFRRDVVGEGNFLWHKHFKKRCRMLAVLNLGEFNEIL